MANPIREDLTTFGFSGGSGSSGLVTRVETLEENVETLEDDIDKAFLQMNYSTSEHIIGEWIDGKPIYSFTFEVTHQGQGQQYYTVPHDITNVNFVGIEQYCIFPNTNNITPLPYGAGDIYSVVRKEQNDILVSTLIDRSNTKVVTTIKYTKNE